MDAPHRIKVKVFVQDAAMVELGAFTPVFHRWIQERKIDGLLLLDVADYKHVQNGPGIVLIGHEADYGLDMGGGRPGLVYDHKRGWDEAAALPERVRGVFSRALTGVRALESDPALDGLRFRFDEAELTFVDRLRAPNTPEAFDRLTTAISPVLDALYGPDSYAIERASEDPRTALALRIHINSAPELSQLLERV